MKKFIIEVLAGVSFFLTFIFMFSLFVPDEWMNLCYFLTGWWACVFVKWVSKQIDTK